MRFSILPLLLFALPLAEIAGFVVVGRQIGALATVGLVLAASIGGALLLRHQGFGVMQKVRREIDAGRDPSRQLAHGAMMVIAALLLIVPGFITDIAAFFLLLPPVRDLAWRLVKSRVTVMTDFGSGGFSRRERATTIDLDDADYARQDQPGRSNPESPWRRLGDRD
ncbi:MAG: FxsA family protein [Mesorhizobium sp.]